MSPCKKNGVMKHSSLKLINSSFINAEKIKELIIDFRHKKTEVSPILIRDHPVEILSSYT